MIITKDQIDKLKRTTGFIALEGVNGAGKSTLLDSIAKLLKSTNSDFILTKEPGGSPTIGAELRNLLLNNKESISELGELLLFAADRTEHVEQVIKPALAEKQIVLTDRYYYSTLAFQGYGRGLNLDKIATLNELAMQGVKPDLVMLLDLDPAVGLSRNQSADKSRDSFEEETLEFHQKIRKGFLEIAKNSPENFIIISAEQAPEVVKTEAIEIMNLYIDRHNANHRP